MDIKKLEKVYGKMKENRLSQILVSEPSSVFYLTGLWIHPGERFMGLLLRLDQEPILFLHKLFPVNVSDLTIIGFSDADDYLGLVAKKTDSQSPLGIDKHLFAGFLIGLMEKRAASAYVNGSDCVDMVRAIKSADELEKLRIASRINDQTMEVAKKSLRIGMTEKDLEKIILETYWQLGADDISFPPIVAFQEDAANPHHENTNRKLKAGDMVLLDIGCKKDNYCSDMTRTFFTKKPSPEQAYVYDLVRKANQAAQDYIRPGVRLCDIDERARSIIRAGGHDGDFTHRLGHFIGIDTHEYGDVSPAYDWPVQAGMVFSIEPGIYLANNFGVRLEDLVIVTENGCEVINHVSKEITLVPLG